MADSDQMKRAKRSMSPLSSIVSHTCATWCGAKFIEGIEAAPLLLLLLLLDEDGGDEAEEDAAAALAAAAAAAAAASAAAAACIDGMCIRGWW